MEDRDELAEYLAPARLDGDVDQARRCRDRRRLSRARWLEFHARVPRDVRRRPRARRSTARSERRERRRLSMALRRASFVRSVAAAALCALASAAAAQPDLEGFWTLRIERTRSGQALID